MAPGPHLGSLVRVQSLIISGIWLRHGRLLAAGKRRSHALVANYHRCFAPPLVVLSVGSASLFGQNGFGTREVCKLSNWLLCIILKVFVKYVRSRDGKPIFGHAFLVATRWHTNENGLQRMMGASLKGAVVLKRWHMTPASKRHD